MGKVHSLAVFVLFAFVAITKNASTNKEQTNLRKISDDLRILSRVTNAIGLHFYSIQNGSYFSNILAETFRIPLMKFEKVIDVKTAETIQELGRMSDEYEKFIVDQTAEKKWNEPELNTGSELLDFFAKLKEKDINVTVTLNDLKNSVVSLKDDALFVYCDGVNAENIEKFYWLFKEKPKKYVPLADAPIIDVLKAFGDQSSKIRECVQQMSNFTKAFRNFNIEKIETGMKSIQRAIQLASEFSSLSSIQSPMAETFEKILQTTQDSKMIWDVPTEDMLEASLNFFRRLSKSTSSLSEYGEPIELIYTAGFRDASDWIKIMDDLKDPWFKKHIVQGASIKNLSDTLEPYRDIAIVIVDMDATWKDMVKNITEDVVKASRLLLEIRSFAEIAKLNKNLLTDTETEFKKCMPKNGVKFDGDKFQKFQENKQPIDDFISQMNIALKAIRKMEEKLSDVKSEIDHQQNFETFLIFLEAELLNKTVGATATLPPSLEILNNLHAEMKWFVGGKEGDFFDILHVVAEMTKEVSLAKSFLADTDRLTIRTDVDTIIGDLKIVDSVKCLSDISENLFLSKKYFKMVGYLLDFPTEKIKELIRFLTRIGKIQDGIESITKSLAAIPRGHQLIPKMENSRALTENFGKSIHVLESMNAVRESRNRFLNIQPFTLETQQVILTKGLADWIQPKFRLERLLNEVDELEKFAGKLQNRNLTNMTLVFEAAGKIPGLGGTQSQLRNLHETLSKGKQRQSDVDFFKFIQTQEMDFAKHSARLSNAKITTEYLKKYFDEMFGRGGATTIEMIVHKKTGVNEVDVVAIVAGVVVSVAFLFFTIYGFTERGKEHYGMLWFYYFAKHEHYERRWRYSLFLDRLDGKNGLLDAINEGNTPNLIKALKSGAYIDAYNKFGNTALHVAIKLALPDQVKLLIKNGADRLLPNYKNLLPIQLVPQNYDNLTPEDQVKFEKIRKIYLKMEKKWYRVVVPRKLPVSSFCIYPDETVDVNLMREFQNQFASITTSEATSATTHIIHPTDENGVLHTDRVDALAWIFQGAIHVKEQWMKDCLKDEKIIGKDYEYLIRKVKYKGVVYDTVVEWTQSMAKATMPYLVGVFVFVVSPSYENMWSLFNTVASQGGVMLEYFPRKIHFNTTSRAYHHANRGPLFLICDKTEDLDAYKNDPDGMYSVFTEEEFYAFMLRREIHTETRINPPPVIIGDE